MKHKIDLGRDGNPEGTPPSVWIIIEDGKLHIQVEVIVKHGMTLMRLILKSYTKIFLPQIIGHSAPSLARGYSKRI